MQVFAYNLTRNPREFVNFDNLEPFLLNKDDKDINFNPGDYIDASLVINDNQIAEGAIDADFEAIGALRTEETQGTTTKVWYWRVINRIRNRQGQWFFSLQADVFKNWTLNSFPIRANKLNILSPETFPLVLQRFAAFPHVQIGQEIIRGSTPGVAVVYATEQLSTSDKPNQFTLKAAPPILENMPPEGTKYYSGISVTENVADFAAQMRWFASASTTFRYGATAKPGRVFENGDTLFLDDDWRSSILKYNIGFVNYATNKDIFEALSLTTFSPTTLPGTIDQNRTIGGGQLPRVATVRPAPIASALINMRNSVQYAGRTPDVIPSIVLQNENRHFVKAGKIYRLRLTNTTESFSDMNPSNNPVNMEIQIFAGSTLEQPVTVSTPFSSKITGFRTFTTVTYEEIGNAEGNYYINWDDSIATVPPMAGSNVFAYAFEFQSQLIAESLVSYFYRNYGSVIQDAQWFDNLSIEDINARTNLADITLDENPEVLFSIYNITDSTTGKNVNSEILTSFLQLPLQEKLYRTVYIMAPDGSSLLEVDKNLTSDVLRIEYDLLPLEGKCYAHFDYNGLETGVYNSDDTQKQIMWRAGKFSGSLSAFVEYTLQNSTFQQITNAGFGQTETNNKLLDAQQMANLNFQKQQQQIQINQMTSNAFLSLFGGLAGAAAAGGKGFLGAAGIGLVGNAFRQDMNMNFQKQANAVQNEQTAYNNGVATALRANELALAKQVNDLNIQAISDRPNIIVPSNGVSIKRVDGVRVCLFAIPATVQQSIRDIIRRFGFDLDIVWTYNQNQNIMGQFLYLPFTPKINEFLQTMLTSGLYRENYQPFGDNILVQ